MSVKVCTGPIDAWGNPTPGRQPLPNRNRPTAARVWSLSCSLAVALAVPLGDLTPAIAAPELAQAETTQLRLFVHPKKGSDRGSGREDDPLATLTRALELAGPNTEIVLQRGTYDRTSGESFPIVIDQPGVVVRGRPEKQGRSVDLVGGGIYDSPTAGEQHVAVAVVSNARILGLSISNPDRYGSGIWVETSSPEIARNTFAGSGLTGVALAGNSTGVVANNYFAENGSNGIAIAGAARPEVVANYFDNTGYGARIVDNAAPRLRDNQFDSNRVGVLVSGSAQPVLRNNRIEDSDEDGILVLSQARPDLGTPTAPGGNAIGGSGQRAIRNLTDTQVTLSAVGNDIDGETEGHLSWRGQGGATAASTPPAANPRPALPPNGNAVDIFVPPPGANATEEAPAASSSPTLPQPTPLWDDNSAPAGDRAPLWENDSANGDRSTSRPVTLPTRQPALPRLPAPTRSPQPSNEAVSIPIAPPPQPAAAPPPRNPSGSNLSVPPNPSSLGDFLVVEPNTDPNARPPRNPNALPVPSGSIPVSGSQPPASAARARAVGGRFRVLVETSSRAQESQVRSVVPEAFRSSYQGRSVMQVGIFSTRENAEEIALALSRAGLQAKIVPL